MPFGSRDRVGGELSHHLLRTLSSSCLWLEPNNDYRSILGINDLSCPPMSKGSDEDHILAVIILQVI